MPPRSATSAPARETAPPAASVSIVLATYNGAAFIAEQLQSLLAQERFPDELIITDDGSTDATLSLVQDFSTTAPFTVRILPPTQRARGCTANFTHGIHAASSDIILLCDQDDVWLPTHVSELAAALENDPELLCVASDSECVASDLRPLGYSLRESERFHGGYIRQHRRVRHSHLEVTVKHFVAPGHGLAFRRTLVPYLAPMSSHWIHDQWIFLLASACGKVGYLPATLTRYRQHRDQSFGGTKTSLVAWADMTASVSVSRELADVQKWEDLLQRCLEIKHPAIDDTVVNLLKAKIAFTRLRVTLRPKPLLFRAITVAARLLQGDYHRLARGWIAALRDVYGKK